MYNLISLLSRDSEGNVFHLERRNPEIERIKETISDFFKENGIRVKLVTRKNSLFFEGLKEMNQAIRQLYLSGCFYELFNMNKVDHFEKKMIAAKTYSEVMNLLKELYLIQVSVFLFPNAIYSMVKKEFKDHEREFFRAILPERENFFLRIAKNGLKGNFSKILGKTRIMPQKLGKKPKLNDGSYWEFNFIDDNVKKNIHALNTLQYLLDEKNNYASLIRSKAEKVSDVYSLPKENKLVHTKKYTIFNQESRFLFIDRDLYYYLKTNDKIYSYQLSKKRLAEFERLYSEGFLMKNFTMKNFS